MAKIVTLKDKDNNTVYPQTKTDAVYDGNGDSVQERVGEYVDKPEFVEVHTDAGDKVLYGVKSDGDFHFGGGIPSQIHTELVSLTSNKVDKEVDKSLIDSSVASKVSYDDENETIVVDNPVAINGPVGLDGATYSSATSPEYIYAILDSQENVVLGIKMDGKLYVDVAISGSPTLSSLVAQIEADVTASIDEKIAIINSIFSLTPNPEWLQVTTDSEGKVLWGIRKDGTEYSLHNEESTVKDIEDYKYPECVFAVWNTLGYDNVSNMKEYSREYLNTIYPDRIYNNAKALFWGAAASKVLSSTVRWRALDVATVLREDFVLPISGKDYNEISGTVKLITTKNTVAKNKNVTLMAIGDSITDSNADFWDKTGNWSYEVFTKELFQMDDIDNVKDASGNANTIQCHLIGTEKGFERIVTYREETINHTNDCHEGRGGWAAADYLRHPLDCSYTAGDYDILGLRTVYGDPVDQDKMLKLIGETCWGLYPPDITESAWTRWHVYVSGIQDVSWADATSSQKEQLRVWATDTIVNNPWNPFYDINAYNASTNSMFSWDTYYARYKTVENDGVTPLTNKGSKYIDGTTVCKPNYFVIALGANDTRFKRGEDAAAADIKLMADLLHASTGSKVIVLTTGWPASQIPEYHPNSSQFMDTYSKQNIPVPYIRNKELMRLCGTLANQESTGIYYCPSFFVQGFDTSRAHKNESLSGDYDYDYTWCASDVHPGCYSHKQIGYQLYSLIMYTLSL